MVRTLAVKTLAVKMHVVPMVVELQQFLVQVVKIVAVLITAEQNLLLVGAANTAMKLILLLHVVQPVLAAVDPVVQIAAANMILLVLM